MFDMIQQLIRMSNDRSTYFIFHKHEDYEESQKMVDDAMSFM